MKLYSNVYASVLCTLKKRAQNAYSSNYFHTFRLLLLLCCDKHFIRLHDLIIESLNVMLLAWSVVPLAK